MTALLAVLDLALGQSVLLIALLVLPALVCALVARWGDTVAVATLGVVLALASIFWNEGATSAEIVALVVVALGGFLAVLVALLRAAAEVNLRRFRLLSAIADVGNEATALEDAVARLLDMLTPDFADACAIDASLDGHDRRLGVRPGERERRLRAGAAQRAGDLAARAAAARPRTHDRTLTALLAGSGRRYSPSDVAFAEVFAGRAAVVLDNAGLTSELDAAERQLGTVLDGLAEAVTVTDANGRAVYANEAAVELLRLSSARELTDAAPGETMARFDVYDEAGEPVGPGAPAGLRACLPASATREPLLVRNVVKATGEERWLLNKTTTHRGRATDRVVRVVNVIEDVTEPKRAELAHRLLAEASDALASSLDYEATLQRVADVAVPDARRLVRRRPAGARTGRVQSVAIAHADPEKVALARRLRARYPVRARRARGPARRVMRGESERRRVGDRRRGPRRVRARRGAPRDAAGDRLRVAGDRAARRRRADARRAHARALDARAPVRRRRRRARRGARPARRDRGRQRARLHRALGDRRDAAARPAPAGAAGAARLRDRHALRGGRRR